eukprot:COSAG06_NODE_4326_length_4357_cov_3.590621_9_plen_50_part_00
MWHTLFKVQLVRDIGCSIAAANVDGIPDVSNLHLYLAPYRPRAPRPAQR